MRRALFIVTAVLAGTAAATQLPLGTEQAPSRPMSDPSFPQPGSGLDRLGGVGIGGSAGVPSGKGMTLADTLTVDRRGSVWWDYARDIGSVTARLHERGNKETTILVPIDSAIMRLPRKPHQSENGDNSEDAIRSNIQKFLSAHIIPADVQLPTEGSVETLLDGLSIEVTADEDLEGRWRIQPGDIAVLDVKQAANGQVLYIDGVVQS